MIAKKDVDMVTLECNISLNMMINSGKSSVNLVSPDCKDLNLTIKAEKFASLIKKFQIIFHLLITLVFIFLIFKELQNFVNENDENINLAIQSSLIVWFCLSGVFLSLGFN